MYALYIIYIQKNTRRDEKSIPHTQLSYVIHEQSDMFLLHGVCNSWSICHGQKNIYCARAIFSTLKETFTRVLKT